ncbi:MAG: twin-arginine translocation signal domain-containing protein [Verrucomicrobia bacterium]|nr:twin-arginine translocation signal domain-containing protein [Verrucomicrobiota bacterium]
MTIDANRTPNRRQFLRTTAAAGLAAATAIVSAANPPAPARRKARVAITMDLEMARNFPRWEDTHWDYTKGHLNEETKRYALAAARRVKFHGGVIHFFLVGQALEQENVEWLQELHREGHPIGNHTYDHVNVLARRPEDLQFRFQRAPWLLRTQDPVQAIRENIEQCSQAMRHRLGFAPAGFRTPGGFAEGLQGRPDIQQLLLDCGFSWVSCRYPAHPYGQPGTRADHEVLAGIVKAQSNSQPFVYPTGLIEVPMSPISDVGAFRNCRWPLEDFLRAIRAGVTWAIEQGAAFDLLTHPSVLYPNDPEFRTIDLVCDLVGQARDGAALADCSTLATLARA